MMTKNSRVHPLVRGIEMVVLLVFLIGCCPNDRAVAQVSSGTEKPAQNKPAAEPARKDGEAVRAAVVAARTAVKACKGLKGDARKEAVMRAVAAWRAVAKAVETDGGSSSTRARGHYEAGVLLRKAGELSAAEAEFGTCLSTESKGKYVERAYFERAQVRRRSKQYDEAIADYAAAAKVDGKSSRAASARCWIGRCHASKGDREAAVAALRAAVDAAVRPKSLIEATNYLAKELISGGDLDGAASAIQHAEQKTAAVRAKGGKDGERVQRALDGMAARKALQRARDRQNGTGQDAVDLVEQRGGGSVGGR